jgi:hypothetical protein
MGLGLLGVASRGGRTELTEGFLPSHNCPTGVNFSPLLVAHHLSSSQDSILSLPPSLCICIETAAILYTDRLPPYKLDVDLIHASISTEFHMGFCVSRTTKQQLQDSSLT